MSDVEQRRRLRPRQSAVSRADLLWLLHVLGDEDGAEAAGLLGFRRAEVEAPEDEPMPPMPRIEISCAGRPSFAVGVNHDINCATSAVRSTKKSTIGISAQSSRVDGVTECEAGCTGGGFAI